MMIGIKIIEKFDIPEILIAVISYVLFIFIKNQIPDKKMYFLNKYIYFFIGFLILALAEIIVRYSGTSWNNTFIYYLIPIGASPLFYFALLRAFKYENLSQKI